MQPSIDTTPAIVAQTKCHFENFSERMLHLLSFVPDDKLMWAPSPTAKSSLRIAAHGALSSRFFADVITSKLSANMPSPEEFFQGLHEGEREFTTRESVTALVKATTAELCQAIDTVNADNIDTARDSPFGGIPTRFWLNQGSEHMVRHVGQLEYLQTIWGDLDNHMG